MHWLAVAALVAGSLEAGAGASWAQEEPTAIAVTTNSDTSNGDVSTVSGLIADPGEDGISLREAIEATNNDPGTYAIRFDSALAGSTITVDSDLPPLTGGGVTIEGDVDIDGEPDVTLRRADIEWVQSCPASQTGCGLHIASSRNYLHALTLEEFGVGVLIQPWSPEDPLPTNVALAHNTVSGLVMSGMEIFGVLAGSIYSAGCGAPNVERCWTYTTWEDTTIAGNTIESGDSGISFKVRNAGDTVEGATVADNTIRIDGHDAAIGFQIAGDPLQGHISNVLIARNTVEGSVDIGIDVLSGGERGQESTVEHVQIVNNQVHLTGGADGTDGYCCRGVNIQAGSDVPSLTTLVNPPRYLDDNLVRDVLVRGNSITGTLDSGIGVLVGYGSGGRRNQVLDLRIKRNSIRTSKPGIGVEVVTGDGNPYDERYAAYNRISDLRIKENEMRLGTGPGFQGAGGGLGAAGVALAGGHKFGRDNHIRNVNIARNLIKTAYIGIRLIGGLGPTARKNHVICVPIFANDFVDTSKNVSVRSNIAGATGNRARLAC